MKVKHGLHALGLASLTLLCACGPQAPSDASQTTNETTSSILLPEINITPRPLSMNVAKGYFSLNPQTKIVIGDIRLLPVAEYWHDFIAPSTGFDLVIEESTHDTNAIRLILVNAEALGSDNEEAYTLEVSESAVTIKASSINGIFYGLQSLRQLLPAEIESRSPHNAVEWKAPALTITDEPLYPYRGMHLDVSRSFQPVWFVKRYIDLLAFHKMNYFHWHLSDDQGWRIPIDAYPKLISHSAWRPETVIGHTHDKDPIYDGVRSGGFYTKAQIRDIVAYASDRQITVIPEIDIPGHASTVLAAYPEFGCTELKTEVQGNFGIFPAVLCPTEKTFKFLEAVFTEVAELFPGEYLHVGGDEVLKDQWEASEFVSRLMERENLKDYHEVQSYFIRRVSEIVTKLDKRMIGWNEILDGGVAENATIMSWQGIKGGIEAAELGHDAIMTPFAYTYFDFFQSRSVDEPLAIHGLSTLSNVYSYDPIPDELKGTEKAKHILGTQGQLWTEYIPTPRKAEYMVLPRMSAISEVAWTPVENKSWKDFSYRLPALFSRFDQMGVNASRSVFAINSSAKREGLGEAAYHIVELSTDTELVDIRYTIDGSEPNAKSSLYRGPFELRSSSLVRARAQDKISSQLYLESQLRTDSHKALGAEVSFNSQPSAYAVAEPNTLLTDGISARDQVFNPSDWLAFYGEVMDVSLTFSKSELVSELSFYFNPGKHRQMFPPVSIEIFGAKGDGNWTSIIALNEEQTKAGLSQNRFSVKFTETELTQLRVVAQIHAPIPSTETSGLRYVALYVDELIVH